MTQHCVPTSVGYKNTEKILDQKYGNSYNIMDVYRKDKTMDPNQKWRRRKLSEVLQFYPEM